MIETRLKKLVAREINGDNAQKHVREITQYHRSLGSSEYDAVIDYLLSVLQSVGLQTTVVACPLDNKTSVGAGISPYAWEPHDAILKIVSPEVKTLVTFHDTPTCITSWSATTPPEGVTAELVYVGDGWRDSDYVGKDVRGKIVLLDRGYSRLTYPLAVEKYGALGFICDDIIAVPPDRTRETFADAVIWYTMNRSGGDGGPIKGWCLAISPRTGDYLRDLARKGPVKLHVKIDTRTFEGTLRNPLGIIEGSEYPDEEVLLIAHACHTRPGGSDNAAGCGHITEVARTLMTLIQRGDIPRPKRSIKFLYGPEGTQAAVYMDSIKNDLGRIICAMGSHVGIDPQRARGPLRLYRPSAALPHFLTDLCTDLLEDVPEEFPHAEHLAPLARYKEIENRRFSKVPFAFSVVPRISGGDSLMPNCYGVPAIEMMRALHMFWHTPYDTWQTTSPDEFTKVGWVYAVAAFTVANAGPADTLRIMHTVETRSEQRLGQLGRLAREALLESPIAEIPETLEKRIDTLRYSMERDLQAISSAETLVRKENAETRQSVQAAQYKLQSLLCQRQAREEEGLREFAATLAGGRKSLTAPRKELTLPAEASWRPKRTRPGMLPGMLLAAELPKGETATREHLASMGYVCELGNLSDGKRTIQEIARVIEHELGGLDLGIIINTFKNMEKGGFVTIER